MTRSSTSPGSAPPGRNPPVTPSPPPPPPSARRPPTGPIAGAPGRSPTARVPLLRHDGRGGLHRLRPVRAALRGPAGVRAPILPPPLLAVVRLAAAQPLPHPG